MTQTALRIKIWPSGPKFPSQSINAECLAVIAYFQLLADRHDDIASVDFEPSWGTTDSPNGQLPLLSCACDQRFGGAASIFRHLRQCVAIEKDADLDSWMSDDQQADCIAWTSLVLSRATTLLDLYLFLTPDNYTVTRSAYTAFLPLYANYTIPPAHRKAAEARSGHLSVASALESSASSQDEQQQQQQQAPITALGTGGFAFGNSRVRGMAAKAGRRMGLENMVGALLDPLQELLGKKKYFLDDTKASSLDALILGFLHLVQIVQLPDVWAKDIMASKYPTLATWTQKQTVRFLSNTHKSVEETKKQ